METAQFESDSLLQLLTDALRRGPGTPEWHDAIELLKRDGVEGADEYRLLLTVRERLESGQAYREIRPGPAFTRELFDKIESDDGVGSNRKPVTTIVVALVCLVALVGSIGLLVSYLSKISSIGKDDLLASQLFMTPLKTWTFAGPMPADLKRVGPMKLESPGALRPVRDNESADATVVYSDQPVNLSGGGACVEMQVRYQPGPTAIQLIVSGNSDFGIASANSSELAIVCESAGLRVTGNGAAGETRSLPPGVHTLRLKLSDSRAIAELNGQQVWAGEHGFGRQAFVGVRLAKTGKSQGGIAVQSLRVLAP